MIRNVLRRLLGAMMLDSTVVDLTEFLRKRESTTPRNYTMSAKGKSAEVFLYGPIGMSWFGEGITAKQFIKDLKALGDVTQIDLRINSEGGSVAEAEAIFTHLNEHKAKITSFVDGMSMSAATIPMLAGDTIKVSSSGFIMIHEARMLEYGTAKDFRKVADILDRTNDKLVAKYVQRTKKPEKTVRDWMSEETWFIGEEAVAAGFAHEVIEDKAQKAAAISLTGADLYKNLPKRLAATATRRQHADALLARMAATLDLPQASRRQQVDAALAKMGALVAH